MIRSIIEKSYLLLARRNVALVSLFIMVITTIIMMRIDTDLAGFGGKGFFYLQVAFTRSNVASVLSSWKSGGVDMLMGFLWLYYINAVSYAFLFSSAAAYFSSQGKGDYAGPLRMLELAGLVIPFAAALLDWISNTLVYLIFSGRHLMEEMIMASSLIAAIKWAMIAASLILVLRGYFTYRKSVKKGVSRES